MGFSRQEYWRGFPFPAPEDLPHPGMEPASLASPTLAGGFFTTASPGIPNIVIERETYNDRGSLGTVHEVAKNRAQLNPTHPTTWCTEQKP